jgi:outer membrane receptor for ferrienterochelin and colicin
VRFLFWILFLLPICLNAQGPLIDVDQGSINGVIRDKETGDVLPFVSIVVKGEDNFGTESQLDGTFRIDKINAGKVRLEASFIGYKKYILDSILILQDSEIYLDIEMESSFVSVDEVVVTASRKSQTLVSAPVSVDVVKAIQLENQNVTTFDEAFDNLAGVNVSRSSRANVQALSIRGASEVAGGGTGNRVLLLLDGRPVLSPDSGGALWNLVPTNSIERIEVVKGAYSSLFGSSAMGGVINVITREPKSGYRTRVNLNYGFYQKAPSFTGYDRFNDFNNIEISHSNTHKKGGYLVDFSRRQDDGHREKSGFTLYNFYGKYSYNFDNNKKLRISANVNQMYNDTPATWLSRRLYNRVAEHRKDDFQDRREYNADIYYSVIKNENLKYSSRLYFYQNDSEFSFNDDPDNDSTNVNIGTNQIVAESSILAQRWGNITQVDLSVNEKHYLIAGVDMYYDRIVALPDFYLYGRHNVINTGVYLQDEYYATDRLTITGGIRYDYYSILDEFQESNFSPKIALVYNHNKRWSFRTLFAQAFRNPAIAERFIKFTQGGGLTFRPNPDLRSERLKYSFEMGTRYAPGRKFFLDIAYFYNFYNDLISFQQLPDPNGSLLYEVINVNEALLQGVEINTTIQPFDSWNLRLNYTFLDAKDRSPERLNDALPYKRRHSFNLTSSYQYKNIGFHLTGRYRSATEEVFLYPGSEPGEQLVFTGRVDARINNNYSAFIAVNNITDQQYEEVERYRMPGRHFTVGASFDISEQ